MNRILLSIIAIASSSIVALYGSGAYFSDTEGSNINTLEAGEIDLKIGNESYYNGEFSTETSWNPDDLTEDTIFFDFQDLKPGDIGEDTISLRVDTNDAWVCSTLTLTGSAENGVNEPEALLDNEDDGNWDGELDDELYFAFWEDDGDNVLETDEQTLWQGFATELPQGNDEFNLSLNIPLADSNNNVWTNTPTPVVGGETYYIGKAWCFGEMTFDPLTQDGVNDQRSPVDDAGVLCDGAAVTNISQSDSVTGDIEFTAYQARSNDDFVCPGCLLFDQWAEGEITADQGLRKNGTPVLASRSIESDILGEADGNASASTGYYSLGFGGVVIVEFDNPVINENDYDISFYEITGGRNSYPLEIARIEVSQDGLTWFDLGTVDSQDAISTKDLGALSWIKFLRITDETNPTIHDSSADGFDLDAIDIPAYNTCLHPIENTN